MPAYACVYYVCMCVSIYACLCVRASVCMYILISVTFFLTSNLLHLESNIYVGLLAYMRTHVRKHLKLEVRHKNSHGRIHTHILNGQTHATSTHIHVCTHVPTRRHTFIPIHTRADVRMHMYTYSADPDQTPYIVASDQGLYWLLLQ